MTTPDDLLPALTRAPGKPVRITVAAQDGPERDATVLPISHALARGERYQHWTEDNAAHVDALSEGRLGYLHIQKMGGENLNRFERELYAASAGKDGS